MTEVCLSKARFFYVSGSDTNGNCVLFFPPLNFLLASRSAYLVGVAMLLGVAPLLTLPRGKTYAVSAHLCGKLLFHPAVFSRYHDKGARVVAYLPANDTETRQAVAAGADMIITDYAII